MDRWLDKLPKIEKCCVDLKVGCFIIGYLGLIGRIVMLIAAIVSISIGGTNVALGVIDIILYISGALLSLGLVIGLHKDNDEYIYFWCVYIEFSIIFGVTLAMVSICLLQVFSFIVELIGIVVNGYFLSVVYTYYRQEEEEALPNKVTRWIRAKIADPEEV